MTTALSGFDKLDINHIEKLITVSVVITLILLIDQNNLMTTVIIGGQGHFLLTFYYQYRARRFLASWPGIMTFGSVISVSYWLAWMLEDPFLIFVNCFFFFHHFYDEMKLAGISNTFSRTLYFLPALANLIMYTYFEPLIGADIARTLLIMPFAALVLLAFNRDFLLIPLHVSIFNIAMATMLYSGTMDPVHFWAFLLFSHSMLWYVRMGQKFKNESKQRFTGYIKTCVLFNVCLALAWLASTNIAALSFVHTLFFHPYAYWVWALMHLIYTLRPDDYLNMLPGWPNTGSA